MVEEWGGDGVGWKNGGVVVWGGRMVEWWNGGSS